MEEPMYLSVHQPEAATRRLHCIACTNSELSLESASCTKMSPPQLRSGHRFIRALLLTFGWSKQMSSTSPRVLASTRSSASWQPDPLLLWRRSEWKSSLNERGPHGCIPHTQGQSESESWKEKAMSSIIPMGHGSKSAKLTYKMTIPWTKLLKNSNSLHSLPGILLAIANLGWFLCPCRCVT